MDRQKAQTGNSTKSDGSRFKLTSSQNKQTPTSTFQALQNTVLTCIPVVLPSCNLQSDKLNWRTLSSNSAHPSSSKYTELKNISRVSSEENVSLYSINSVQIKRKVTIEQIHLWETNLSSLLNDPNGLALFGQFLKTEFSLENLQFWEACEQYRRKPAKTLPEEAQKIYQLYLSVQSPREVNLDSKTRLKTISLLSTPTAHIFNSAQRKIQALMEKDSYQRFLRSSIFLNFKKSIVEGKAPTFAPVCHESSSERVLPKLVNATKMPLSKQSLP